MCTERIRNEEFWEELILFIYVAKRNCTIGCPHQVNTAKAEAEMAYQLQASKVNARIKEEEMQVRFSFDGNFEFWQTKVKVVEREQQIAIQQQEIQRKEKELNSKVWKDITGSDFWTERWGKILKGQVFILRESLCQIRAPAEAEKYRLEKIAEAEKSRTVLEAEAEVIFFIRVVVVYSHFVSPIPNHKKVQTNFISRPKHELWEGKRRRTP